MAISAISNTIPVFAGTAPVNTKATATLASSCQISAQSVNFGSINLQAAQAGITSTSNMTLLCTKNSTYKITLAFGGIYGQTGPADYWTTSATPYYYHYDANGNYIGESMSQPGAGYTFSSTRNADGQFVFTNNSAAPYTYGVLNGASKGDTIGYKITVPGDDTKVWNSVSNAYTGTGTGANQNLPIKATIQTGNHGSQYPAADTYMDTVTATVSY